MAAVGSLSCWCSVTPRTWTSRWRTWPPAWISSGSESSGSSTEWLWVALQDSLFLPEAFGFMGECILRPFLTLCCRFRGPDPVGRSDRDEQEASALGSHQQRLRLAHLHRPSYVRLVPGGSRRGHVEPRPLAHREQRPGGRGAGRKTPAAADQRGPAGQPGTSTALPLTAGAAGEGGWGLPTGTHWSPAEGGADGSTSTVLISSRMFTARKKSRDETNPDSSPKVLKRRRGSAVKEACTLL